MEMFPFNTLPLDSGGIWFLYRMSVCLSVCLSICQFVLPSAICMTIFSFLDDYLSKCQWIFTKFSVFY